MHKLLTIVGARPQFIKAAVVSKALRSSDSISEIMLHTGQHFDENMSDVFFKELGIPTPEVRFDINGGSHGEMTGRMLIEIEKAISQIRPDGVLVYGDTNSTLAGALAASKLRIPIFHVEAGLRSGNMAMPEEINRILTDQISSVLYCPTDSAMKNLYKEGLGVRGSEIALVGDVMQDASLMFASYSAPPKGIKEGRFCLCTIHRAENTDTPDKLAAIFQGLEYIHKSVGRVIMPIHPRTKALCLKYGIKTNIELIPPASYFEMLWLLNSCGLVLTDSGGLQKEAYFFKKKCITIRDQTEWTELVEGGYNELVPTDAAAIYRAAEASFCSSIEGGEELYGGGQASKKIVGNMEQFFVQYRGA